MAYTKSQIEAGEGRYTQGGTCVIQKGNEDVFQTEPKGSGWTLRPGWHVAGDIGSRGQVEWCDLRDAEEDWDEKHCIVRNIRPIRK